MEKVNKINDIYNFMIRLECELCSWPLPKRIELNGHFLDLADLDRPE